MAYFKYSQFSSSSMPPGKWKYDAFLSFRGEDTRYNFVDHLYAALVQRGLCVFKDDEELKTGKAISPELLKAIEGSRFAVVVFSKNYANSSWCLIELAKIMECRNRMGQKVLPVFYHVDPSDIRRQKNNVDIFFQQHEKKLRKEMHTVKKWRKALTAAANLSGLHISKKFKEGESTYINKIVQDILGDIQPCDMEKKLVGINSHMDALNSLLGKKRKRRGKHLCRKAFVWESAFDRLAKTPNAEIFETLKLSFDGLEVSKKNIFLDIACFFKGKPIEHVTKVLRSCGFDPLIGISVLIEKSLITVSNNRIGMHDLTQQMGWKIVRESFPNSRLWQLEDIHDYINKNRKLKAIEAIVVSDKQYDDDDDEYEENVGFSANVLKE
ncbi:hypothetical protein L1987_65318 [Smallanthus sonchifolius]|uniref:Uncharacterized protein n=1 Tax=Smallanthus sonchifolius TaxID=185202 RepID=A0ACB9BUC2_9ASTR|nr:hypothetical protein L1987_65318 [Smallanthus sonchifolius]